MLAGHQIYAAILEEKRNLPFFVLLSQCCVGERKVAVSTTGSFTDCIVSDITQRVAAFRVAMAGLQPSCQRAESSTAVSVQQCFISSY